MRYLSPTNGFARVEYGIGRPARSFKTEMALLAGYVLAYVALDWFSDHYPWRNHGLTPWNAPAALSLVLLLVGGLRFAPTVLIATFIGEALSYGSGAPLALPAATALAVCAGYVCVAWILRRASDFDRRLTHRSDIVALIAVVCVAAPVIGTAHVALRASAGLLPWSDFPKSVFEYWMADLVGILVVAPLLLVLCSSEGRDKLRRALPTAEFALQNATSLTILWITCVLRRHEQFKHRYLMFLPLVWMATRLGVAGAAFGTFTLILGMLAGLELTGARTAGILELNWLVLAMAITGLFLGVASDERERAMADLKRSLRLAAAAETAAALAHELNQPLTALSNYGKACRLMLHGDDEQRSRLSETVEKIEHEVSRAGAVVHRLRDFLRNGTTRLAPLAAEQLLQQVCASFGERCKQCGIALTLQAAPDLQPLLIDRTQIEIALDNLLRNACDSIVASAAARRAIHVNVEREAPGYVRVSVRDSGPGIRSEQVHQVFDSIASSKETGMGLGLTLSRAIIEAHGGRLWTEAAASGVFHFTLPEIETPQDEADTV